MIGLVVRVLHLLSLVVFIMGFAFLFAHTIGQFFIRQNRHWIIKLNLILSLLFVVVLLVGATLNNGYPINHVGMTVYFVFLVPAAIGNILRQRKLRSSYPGPN
jgi:hypothetical protein